MSGRHLVLVGLMGAGKSTVARLCAPRLGRPLVDTDELAVTLAGRGFDDLWADGEAEFRRWERAAVADAAASTAASVIACGGGAVVDPDNRRALRGHGVVVWLRARPDTLAARVGDGAGRPLLAGDPLTALRRLARLREPAYEAAAHHTVDVDDLTIELVCERVLEIVRADDASRDLHEAQP